jgi:hypothetical protein
MEDADTVSSPEEPVEQPKPKPVRKPKLRKKKKKSKPVRKRKPVQVELIAKAEKEMNPVPMLEPTSLNEKDSLPEQPRDSANSELQAIPPGVAAALSQIPDDAEGNGTAGQMADPVTAVAALPNFADVAMVRFILVALFKRIGKAKEKDYWALDAQEADYLSEAWAKQINEWYALLPPHIQAILKSVKGMGGGIGATLVVVMPRVMQDNEFELPGGEAQPMQALRGGIPAATGVHA